VFLEHNTGARSTLISLWVEFSDVDTNVPLLRLLQKICGGEDFSKTSAKQLRPARSGDRTVLSQVCLEEETGSTGSAGREDRTTETPPQHRAPTVLPSAKVGTR
jgi:hypothetical protein